MLINVVGPKIIKAQKLQIDGII